MGKWVEVEDIQQPAAAVAAEILQARVEVVTQRLPLAAHEYDQDVEHVHQLRVGCRRSGAALQSFRELLKGKAKRLRKTLRDIRRAAGPARDTDVLLMRLEAESDNRKGQQYILNRLREQRAESQLALLEVASEENLSKLVKHLGSSVDHLLEMADDPQTVSFDVYAHKAMHSVAKEMFRLARMQDPTINELHEMRIAGKRLRYSIELFHDAFPVALRKEVYPLIEKIQSKLGKLNDQATAQVMFQRWLADMPPDEHAAQLARRVVEDYEATEQIRDEFLKWWTPKRVMSLESELGALIQP